MVLAATDVFSLPWVATATFLLGLCYLAKQIIAAQTDRLRALPGPWGLPLVGYLPFLGKYPYKTLTKLSETYGDIFQLKLGRRTLIVLNSRELMREAFLNDPAFAGRPNTPLLQAIVDSGPCRFAFRTGDVKWKFLRKIAVRTQAILTNSRKAELEELCLQAWNELAKKLHGFEDCPVDPHKFIFECIADLNAALNFGTKIGAVDDSVLQAAAQMHGTAARAFKAGDIVDCLPLGGFLAKMGIQKTMEGMRNFNEASGKFLEARTDAPENDDEVRDLLGALLRAGDSVPQDELDQIGISRDAIRYIAQDMFGASLNTTFELFRWALNIMAAEQEVQHRAQAEIDEVLQGSAPLATQHSVMTDTELRGYFIPSNATIVPNLWSSHQKGFSKQIEQLKTLLKSTPLIAYGRLALEDGAASVK